MSLNFSSMGEFAEGTTVDRVTFAKMAIVVIAEQRCRGKTVIFGGILVVQMILTENFWKERGLRVNSR